MSYERAICPIPHCGTIVSERQHQVAGGHPDVVLKDQEQIEGAVLDQATTNAPTQFVRVKLAITEER